MAVEINVSVSHGPALDDNEDHFSDTSSILTEIGSQEFPGFFVEHDHRLFPSHGDPPYPFPVDADEQVVRTFRSPPCNLPFCTHSHANPSLDPVLADHFVLNLTGCT
jgi:hypothetical protein